MKMELIEGSETSAIRNQTPGNYPKENILRAKENSINYIVASSCISLYFFQEDVLSRKK